MDYATVHHPETLAGDPFAYAAGKRRRDNCPACFGGFITITVEEDDEEWTEAVPCCRCNGEDR